MQGNASMCVMECTFFSCGSGIDHKKDTVHLVATMMPYLQPSIL